MSLRENRCMKCGDEFWANYKSNVCIECETDKEIGFPHLIETDSLPTLKNVSRTRLQEMDKRVMLPDKVKDKDYVVGTRERGKIKDKTVDLTP